MNCDGLCNGKITDNHFNCATCNKNFCSDICSIEHIIESHKKKQVNEDYYSFKNFDKVKKGNSFFILGTGAFGEVYLAKHRKDNKMFAIKQMDKAKLYSLGIKPEQILHEISIHLKLLHENIARLYSYYEDESAFYLIMEYAEKGTLFNLIQNSKGLSEEKAFKYFIQVANAIYYLHSNNLMHRDLKPENCLIDNYDNIKLCDFGWTVECNNKRVTFCGTYEYMAPEIIKELPYTNMIDVWSLGVLLYELIHSYSPFRAKYSTNENSIQVLKNIIKYNIVIEKNVSEECKDLIYKLLSPNSNNRLMIKDVFVHPWVYKFLDKSKESTLDTINTTFCHNTTDKLFDMVLNRIQKKKKNKLILKVEKSEKVHKQISTLERISPIKEIAEESQSMLREIREIGKQIDMNNKKFDQLTMKTNKMKEKIEKSISIDYSKENFSDIKIKKRQSSYFSIPDYTNNLLIKNEISTQTEVRETTWSKFLKLFQCSN